MEARGFGRSGSTRAPRPPWSTRDRLALPRGGPARGGGGAVALASVVDLSFSYPAAPPALRGRLARARARRGGGAARPVRLGQVDALRALAGLVPHFHGGRFAGRVVVAGLDTRGRQAGRARRHGRDRLPGPGGPGRDDDRRERGRLRAREPRRRRPPRSGRASSARSPRSTRSTSGAGRRSSSPAASSSASASPRRSRSSRGCCSSTSRPPSSTRGGGALPRRRASGSGATVVLSEHRVAARARAGDARRLRRRRPDRPRRPKRRGARVAGGGAPPLDGGLCF